MAGRARLPGHEKEHQVGRLGDLLSPVSRVVTYYLAPLHRAQLNGMLHTGLDSIMFGCLLAMLWRSRGLTS